jgi:hypothetical protein
VRKHLENIYEKLSVGSRIAALAKLRDLKPDGGAAPPVACPANS